MDTDNSEYDIYDENNQIHNYNISTGKNLYAAHSVIMTLVFYLYLLVFCTLLVQKAFFNLRINNLI